MPTSRAAFAMVAAALSGVDPDDYEAVTLFYRRQFLAYPMPARALISDFLIGQSGVPSAEDIRQLKAAVALPAADMPKVGAPMWNTKYGPPMEYASDQPAKPVGSNESVAMGV
jgi:hypothetical protein